MRARSDHSYTFWLLMLALVFHALPHRLLVAGFPLLFLHETPGRDPHHHRDPYDQKPAIHSVDTPPTFLKTLKTLTNVMVNGCAGRNAFGHLIGPDMRPDMINTRLF